MTLNYFKDIPMKIIVDSLTNKMLETFFPYASEMQYLTIHAKIDKMMWEVKEETERRMNDTLLEK